MIQSIKSRGDPLGRYYTDPSVGQIFISLFDQNKAGSILDLGSGSGSLTFAAAKRWGDARIQTVDVDLGSEERLRIRMTSAGHLMHNHLVADVLDENLPEMVGETRFDLAVCNPPYTRIKWRDGFPRILAEAGMEGLQALPRSALSSDIMFIAQLLRLAKPGAEIGVIVPDGLISAQPYRAVRKALLERVRVVRVVQLPRRSFRGTEAQAHVIVFRNEKSRSDPVWISELGVSGVSSPILVSHEDACMRMDHSYYLSNAKASRTGFSLRDIGAEIIRGSLSSAEARECTEPVFHTNCFTQPSAFDYRLGGRGEALDQPGRRTVNSGDILLARVDRMLHKKVCLVTEGHALFSDCIYRIRVSKAWQKAVVHGILSDAGQTALVGATKGVGARMLNKEDLLNLEIVAP